MKVTKTETKEVEVIVDAICNKCGASCKGSIGNLNGLIEARIDGAYDSSHLGDGNVYEFSLCEKCCSELFATFKYPALQHNFLFPEDDMEVTFTIDSLNPLSNDDYNMWTEKICLYMKEGMELDPIPSQKCWRVKGALRLVAELQYNKELYHAGFLVAQEVS